MHRRGFLTTGAAALTAAWLSGRVSLVWQGRRPVPSPAQLRWQRDELALFCHFGVNTFTDREWGDGTENPATFDPSDLDARQWARAARVAGFKAMVLTAKHHDGFCLWPSRTTTHTVARSPWRAGTGDVVREFVTGCRAEGLTPGLYLSPWDRNHPTYGDSPRYNDVYIDQLTELLTNYGELSEVWFDGANGEGPNGRRQEYDWPRVWAKVRELQPNAVMFSDAGPDVRWCGNERGTAGDPNWSTVDPSRVPYPGISGPGIIDALQHGDPDGSVWRPAEADTSIRPGWFYHPAEDNRVRSVDALVNLYVRSVGRNSKLLLNVPPTPVGQLHDTDVARLAGMRSALDAMFEVDVAEGHSPTWTPAAGNTGVAEVDLGRPANVGIVRLAEDITRGQAVSGFRLDGHSTNGAWRTLAEGTTIGYARLIQLEEPVDVERLRVSVTSAVAPPDALSIAAYPAANA